MKRDHREYLANYRHNPLKNRQVVNYREKCNYR